MSFRPIYEGWDIPGRLSRRVRRGFAGIGLNRALGKAGSLADTIEQKLVSHDLTSPGGQYQLAERIAVAAPQLLQTYGELKKPNDLAMLPVIALEPFEGKRIPLTNTKKDNGCHYPTYKDDNKQYFFCS